MSGSVPVAGGDLDHLPAIYRHRFSEADRLRMDKVWQVLVKDCFQKWVRPQDSVLDVGAGLCSFINHIRARRRVAVDGNPGVAAFCASEVEFVLSTDLDSAPLGSELFDVVFMSNFLEHLDSAAAVLQVLGAVRRRLRPEGRLIILQPNFALVGAKYFDFIDHKTILTDASLREALELSGFGLEYFKRRFLPYTSKSALPQAPWMVSLYLRVPLAQYFLGKQSLAVARPALSSGRSSGAIPPAG